MHFKIFLMMLCMLLSIASVTSAATTWWDVKNVHRTEDGCIEYSVEVKDFMNSANGDVFSGIVVMKYGKHFPYNEPTIDREPRVENSIVVLRGTINGKDITNIPLYEPCGIRHIAHRDNPKAKCYRYRKGRLEYFGRYHHVIYDMVVKKKGVSVLQECGCPIVYIDEIRPFKNEENKPVWSMIDSLKYAYDINMVSKTIVIDEKLSSYLEPNMFNGTYMLNGKVYNLDLYKVTSVVRRVEAYPLQSIYENSAIFTMYDKYCVYKEGGVYRVKKGSVSPSFVHPTEEIINYAEIVAKIIGIDINH